MRAAPKSPQQIKARRVNYTLRPFKFPEDMTIIIDTREQTSPLFTRYPPGLTVTSKKLDVGDYSILGFEEKGITVERKQLSDLVSFVSREYVSKTKAKMDRMSEFEWAGLLVEVDKESTLYKPYAFSQVSPESVRQALTAFRVDWGIHVIIGDKETICRHLIDVFIRYYRMKKSL